MLVVLLSTSTIVTAQTINKDSALNPLTLAQAEKIALTQEHGLSGLQWQIRSLTESATANSQLMDPKLQFAVTNVPTDSFNLAQDNMTQVKLGLTQQFPAGDSLKIKKEQGIYQAELIALQQKQRKLMILKEVRLNYFEIYYWEQAKKTVLKNKKIFTQLVDIVQSLFSVGRNNQQDLIHAQLALSRLDDRLLHIKQQIHQQRAKISRWLGESHRQFKISKELPVLLISQTDLPEQQLQQQLQKWLQKHPVIQQQDQKLKIEQQNMQLIKESYKPNWGLNVSYAHRQNAVTGQKRADLISANISMDLPIFTAMRQDKKLLASTYAYEAKKEQRLEVLKQMTSEIKQEFINAQRLQQRLDLYHRLLIPQAKQQTESSLLAYQSDHGIFTDVMRAYIDSLNVFLDERRITVDLLKSKSSLMYYLPSKHDQQLLSSTMAQKKQ